MDVWRLIAALARRVVAVAGGRKQPRPGGRRAPQVGVTVIYDGSYQRLAYPGGDVPIERGVCTDVIVRALRSARALDLQKLVHEDMRAHFRRLSCAARWGLRGRMPISIIGACPI